jgi:hypothetical protein
MPRRSTEQDFWKYVNKRSLEECWIWTGALTDCGYGRVRYHQKGWKAHRLAWVLTHGSIAEGMDILHKCDNPPCCNPNHLFTGTQADNIADMVSKGRHPRNATHYLPSGDRHHSRLHPEVMARGERNGSAILTEEKVIQIRRRREQGETMASLARAFGVAKGNIIFIVHRHTWKHVE